MIKASNKTHYRCRKYGRELKICLKHIAGKAAKIKCQKFDEKYFYIQYPFKNNLA
jgi:hypothetical protein